MSSDTSLVFKDLGLIEYDKALFFQEEAIEKRYLQEIPDTVFFCKHPPVVTLGRSTQASDISGWNGSTVEVSRGGRATYHGPGQRVIYPIIDLRVLDRAQVRPKDVMSYLQNFEQAVLKSLKAIGLNDVHLKEDIDWDENGKKLLNRGLWVENKKVAAFGIAVRKWISYHGCAININKEESAFEGIQPCGYSTSAVGYLEDFLSPNDWQNLDSQLIQNLTEIFQVKKA